MRASKPKSLRWLQAAKDDLFEIADYIALDAPQAAARFVEEIISRTNRLAEFPFLGSECPQYPRARQLIHGNHIIYYTIHRDEIVVRAVVHGARQFRVRWLRRKR
jgi:toxin ParE1/3/4